MKSVKEICLLMLILALSGCAGGLNSIQKKEYVAFEYDGVLVKEKNPVTGAVLGILPGIGSFYVGEVGYGILNLLAWPVSILWDPISGYNGSMSINYDITKKVLRDKKNKEISMLDDQLAGKKIDTSTYFLEKRKIENKYNY